VLSRRPHFQIQWSEIPLAELRASKGPWKASDRFHELATAKAWHLTPGQFWSLPAIERAYMLEYEQAIAKMEQFNREETERKSKVRQMLDKVRKKFGGH